MVAGNGQWWVELWVALPRGRKTADCCGCSDDEGESQLEISAGRGWAGHVHGATAAAKNEPRGRGMCRQFCPSRRKNLPLHSDSESELN
jgi:hypothetical protein